MKEMILIKAELERQLSVINEALKIHSKLKESNGNENRSDVETTEDRRTFLSSEDIERAIMEINGNFSAKDVPQAVSRKFPDKIHYNENSIASSLHKLITEDKLRYVRERSGRKGAIYCKTLSKIHN